MSLTSITITQNYMKAPSVPASGTVTFQLTSPMRNGITAAAEPIVATLNGSGNISAIVYATDDAGTTPDDVAYKVTETLTGALPNVYYIVVPHDAAAGTIALSACTQILPMDPDTSKTPAPSTPGRNYVTANGLTAAILQVMAQFGIGPEAGAITSVFGRTTPAIVAETGDYDYSMVTGAAPIDSPAFINNPTAPTLGGSDSSTNLANMAAVQAAIVNALGQVVPSAPSITTVAPGNAQVVLDWDAPFNSGSGGSLGSSALTGYQIKRSTTSGAEVVIATVGPTVLTYTDSTVSNATTYYYTIVAVNSVGPGIASTEVSALPQGSNPTVPNAPTLLSVTPGNNRNVLSWRAPSNNGGSAITSYTIKRSTSSGAETNLATGVNNPSPTYTDLTAANGTNYFYEVVAVNAIGSSAASNELAGTPTSGSSTVGFSQTAMGLPVNGAKSYSLSDRIFYDAMVGTGSGTGLDLTKYWPRWGGPGNQGPAVWDSNGGLASPYSGGNAPPQTEVELLHPSMIAVSNGMTMNAEPLPGGSPYNTLPYSEYSALAGGMTTDNISILVGHSDTTGSTANFRLPNTGFYLQILAKIPDAQHGAGGTLWLLDPTGGAPEIDIVQPCFGVQTGATGTNINKYPMLCGNAPANTQALPNVGVDASLAFHKYGCEWIPNTSLKMYFDGTVVAQWTASSAGGLPAGGGYEILQQLSAWSPTLGYTSGYAGGTYAYEVAEIAAYAF